MTDATQPPGVGAVEPLPPEVDGAARELFGAVLDAGRGGARRAADVIGGAIDRVLDRVAASVIEDPLDVRDASAAQRRIEEFTNNLGNTTAIVGTPWLVNRIMRFARRGKIVPSAAMIAAGAATFTAVVAGVQHLRVLASFLVHRLHEGDHRVDPAFVRRTVVNLYLDPDAGTRAVRTNRFAGARLAADWGAHAVPLLRAHRTATRVRRAAEAIERLDLDDAIARFERDRAIDLTATARSD
jgi:hypothetical protein